MNRYICIYRGDYKLPLMTSIYRKNWREAAEKAKIMLKQNGSHRGYISCEIWNAVSEELCCQVSVEKELYGSLASVTVIYPNQK